MKKERILWSNDNINIEDWKDYIEELEEDLEEKLTEVEKYKRIEELNNVYLDDEKINLNIQLSNTIIAIADLGFWNGRKQGYHLIDSGNIKDIFNDVANYDYAKFYYNGYNIKSILYHHDNHHNVEYRMIRDEEKLEQFCNLIYNGKPLTRSIINYYTVSIAKEVCNVYGW